MIQLLKKLFGRNPVNYKELVKKGALVIDVRTASEYKAGHVPGSKNYPLDSLKGKVAELKKLNKPVITVCRSGARSGMAKRILGSAGIEAYNGGPWITLKNKIA
jgi:rhodanese-related sulfurtransferase